MRFKLKLYTFLVLSLFLFSSCDLFNPLMGNKKNEPIVEEVFEVAIESQEHAIQGETHSIDITLDYSSADNYQFGSFEFKVAYDVSALTFQSVDPGRFLNGCNWEYFTYRDEGTILGSTSKGIISITAFAETNNGNGNHPDCYNINDRVTNQLVYLNFLVTNDSTLDSRFTPVEFYWEDCEDNIIKDTSDTQFFIHKENNCGLVHSTSTYNHNIDFINGGIDIISVDSIDERGDINLNGIAYEIADAELYSNYFLYGSSVFSVHRDAQIAATDVNADGVPLTLADFAYLIRVLVGDALPYPREVVNDTYYTDLIITNYSGALTVPDSVQISAALIEVEGSSTPSLLASDMTMKVETSGNNTLILIYSLGNDSFTGGMVDIGSNNIISIDMADTEGNQVIGHAFP